MKWRESKCVLYLCVAQQRWVFVQLIDSHDDHQHVNAAGAELLQALWAELHGGRVQHSEHQVRLRPLPPEIRGKLPAQDAELCRHGNVRNAGSRLKFVPACNQRETSLHSREKMNLNEILLYGTDQWERSPRSSAHSACLLATAHLKREHPFVRLLSLSTDSGCCHGNRVYYPSDKTTMWDFIVFHFANR